MLICPRIKLSEVTVKIRHKLDLTLYWIRLQRKHDLYLETNVLPLCVSTLEYLLIPSLSAADIFFSYSLILKLKFVLVFIGTWVCFFSRDEEL